MFELSVEDTFSAAHQVKGYPGDCAGIHGHTYRLRIRVRVEKLDNIGMAVDFRQLKDALKQVVAMLDHKNLDDIPFFKNRNATAEWIAVYVFNEMKKKVNLINSVTVWEGLENSVTYYETTF